MERAVKRQSPFDINLTPENIDGYVDTFLSQVTPECLIGTADERTAFTAILSGFKGNIRNQVSRFQADTTLRKIDEAVAAKHYEQVQHVLDSGAVTEDFIATIREVPVLFSPVQKNIDMLRAKALEDQCQARTANTKSSATLRETAKHSAQVAAAYAADTPVLKRGPKTLIGEQYNLLKLSEARQSMPKNDPARKDIDGIVSDAYGENYALKETSATAERVRQVFATFATAAVLTTVANPAAYASETKTSQVIPNETKPDERVITINDKVRIPVPVNQIVSIEEKHVNTSSLDDSRSSSSQIAQEKQEKSQVVPKKPEKNPLSANEQVDEVKTKSQESPNKSEEKTSDRKADALVFRIPRSAASDKQANKVSDDLDLRLPDTSLEEDKLHETPLHDTLVGRTTNAEGEKAYINTDNEKRSTERREAEEGENKPAVNKAGEKNRDASASNDRAESVLASRDKKAAIPQAQIEGILDEPKLIFKIPREKKSLSEEKPIQITLDETDESFRFSLKKGQKSTGVKPIELPDGLEIVPIPTVPIPAPEAPAPAIEQAPVSETDFVQAAQKMIERGGVWERRGIAMKFFIEDPELACTPSQAAGIVGNLLGESGPEMNPGQNQFGGPAFGIVQWEASRLQDLKEFAKENLTDFKTQLNFMKHELLGKERSAFAAIKTATNRKDAALIVRERYERPRVHRDQERIDYANEVGDAFNKEYQAVQAAKLPAKSETTSPDNILVGWPTTGEEAMELFNQCDSRWGNILSPNGLKACLNACGPTNIAMAVQLLKPDLDVTPKETIEYANANKLWFTPERGAPDSGGVTYDGMLQLAKNWGVNGNKMGPNSLKDFEAYKKILEDGGVIIAAGTGPAPFVMPKDGAHFVTIRGITKDGKFLVADPYPKTPDTNTVAWDAQQIMNSTFGAVVLYK
jgi:hypothetical protein